MSNFFGPQTQSGLGSGSSFFGPQPDPNAIPTVGGNFDAPLISAPRNLIAPAPANLSKVGAPLGLGDLALGQASAVLDRVRARQMSWQDAQKALATLSTSDKQTLAKLRGGAMTIDEQRALNIPSGGGLLHQVGSVLGSVVHEGENIASKFLGQALPGVPVGELRHTPVGQEAKNMLSDVNTTVRDLPAGLYKTGQSIARDIGAETTAPFGTGGLLGMLQGKSPSSHTYDDILKPMAQQYADTYGGFFTGDPLKSLKAIEAHPLGPVLDVLALASAGAGLAGRVASVSRALDTMKLTDLPGGGVRMGTVDRTSEVYQPLGINMEHYVRPTTSELKAEPALGEFSFVHNPVTGKTIFSPVGSDHGAIFDAMATPGGTAKLGDWRLPTETEGLQPGPRVIHGTGTFDGKGVSGITINPDEFVGVTEDPSKIVQDITDGANNTYITKGQLKGLAKSNERNAIDIKQYNETVPKYDPETGQRIEPAWYVTHGGKRIGANFPTKDSAIGYAQSMVTGGLQAAALRNAWRPFIAGEAPVESGYTRLYRGTTSGPLPTGLPDWMAENQGRWFTDNRAEAQRYAGEGGGVSYVDVPTDMAEAFKTERPPQLGGANEYMLPDEYANAARPSKAGQLSQERVVSGQEVSKGGIGSILKPRTQEVPLEQRSPFQIGAEAFLQRPRGSLIDAYNNARGITHAKEITNILDETVGKVLDNPDLAPNRRSFQQALAHGLQGMGFDLKRAYAGDLGKMQAADDANLGPAMSRAVHAGLMTMREASDLVRAGAIFLRPAYIPNNWAGNAFLNVIQQGVYAPINLAKSLVLDKHLGVNYTRAIDQSMGFNASRIALERPGGGYVQALTNPISHVMGAIGDQPFRRAAWLHEARRAGYRTLYDVKRLFDAADAEKAAYAGRKGINDWQLADTPNLQKIGEISNKAQEEIIKFGKYNDVEQGILSNLIFIYSWMRGSGRYFTRFPFEHPVQAAAMHSAANIGQNWLNQEMGGVPSFLIGAIPVGQDSKGNHILVNPFSVNPLGSGQQLIASMGSIANIMQDPKSFNKYSQQDPAQLLNPLLASGLEAYTGGRPMLKTYEQSIAPYRLFQDLEHPGRGQVYPTTREEALGRYVLGSMYPRQSSQAAITRSLQRERKDQPALRIDDETKLMKSALNFVPPPEFVDAYKKDLVQVKQQSDFQHQYASAHGSQGFTNMPASNRADAAIQYLNKYHLMSPTDLASVEDAINQTPSDLVLNNIANALWRMTGAGTVKRRWDAIMHIANNQSLTAARP
jgi:hypothetical protein